MTTAKGGKKSAAPYVYTPLAKCNPGTDKVNFYAVILDAQFPHKSFKSEKYICSFKIGDPSCKVGKATDNVETCTLVMFANRFEDLPISQKVGDIIRVHRAQVGMYKDSKQFTANIFFNSSWALFAGEAVGSDKIKQISPITFFGKNLHFESAEQKTIISLRQWTSKQFADHAMLSTQYISDLSSLDTSDEKKFDFDLQVKILQIVRLDEFTSEIRVIDDSLQIWHAQILNGKFHLLQEGQVVRIRQATLQNHKLYKNVFGLKSHSNIMILPSPCKLVDDMAFNEVEVQKEFELAKLTENSGLKSFNTPLAHPIILSHVTAKEEGRLASFYQLLQTDFDNIKGGKDLFRARFKALATLPQQEESKTLDLLPFLRIHNTKTNTQKEVASAAEAAKLKANEKLVMFVQLLCKDSSTMTSSEFIRINIVQSDGNGFFPGVSPSDLLPNATKKASKENQLKFVWALRTMFRHNAFLEANLKVSWVKGGKNKKNKVFTVDGSQLKQFD